MRKWIGIAVCGLLLTQGGVAAQSTSSPKPIEPGGVRITTRSPEPDKWDARNGTNGARVFVCKTLACPDPAVVTITVQKTLTRHPDPKALERYAKVDLPKQARAAAAAVAVMSDGAIKVDTLTSNLTVLKGYPAVVNETRMSGAKGMVYSHTAILFSGPVMVHVSCRTVNRELARKSVQAFVEAMTIVEGPPPVEPGTPRPPAVESKSL